MTLTLLALMIAAQGAVATGPVPAGAVATAPVAPVEIVIYSDFKCPFCAMFAQAVRELQKTGVDGVDTTLTFKHFPLGIHPAAPMAHQAALAAGEQGKFWEMHDLLFANQQRAQRSDLIDFATELGLDMRRFLAALDSERLRRTIEADVADGEARQITGTPTFYVNGQQYVGNKSFAQLKELVEGERRRAIALAEITDDLLSRGPANASITIEFFADLQSPVSRPAAAVLNDVMKRYPSQVRLQFRNFPLAFHPQAALAHEAAMTAAREGRFWEFLTYALDHQDTLREQDLIALAGRLGLDAESFAATIRSHRYAPRVQADVMAGANKGIRGSPVILVNGRRIDGVPSVQTLVEYVETALETSKPVQ
jgi:protein-disulfide isomerase